MSIHEDIEKVRRLHLEQPQSNILIIDIESSPNLAYVWGLWDQNVSLPMLLKPQDIMCFSAKWYGQSEIQFYSTYHDGHEAMTFAAWDLYNNADIVIGYNQKGYDNKHMNREFLLEELGPPSPYKDIDLLSVVKSKFKFPSNKLDYVAQTLGVGAKTSHTGFQLWKDCMTGTDEEKAAAWALMKTYNMQDVTITEGVYDKVKGWINNHPVVYSIIDPDSLICPKDGSDNLVKTGVHKVGLFEYDRYICEDCGSWYRSAASNRIANLRGI
jgi:hypothetical protein